MCGIAGVYHFRRRQQDEGFMEWCLSTMKHRGPDGAGKWDNGQNYSTAFSRLAIRDVSNKGDQPMVSECGNFCLSFNGEIYNTATLKSMLRPFKREFYSHSDTEVLLYALIFLGVDQTLAVCDGMFAFAFFSKNNNQLVLARDRVGIKPLYVGISGKGIVYSSQYDHLMNHPWFASEALGVNSIGNYLLFGYIPEGEGALENTQLIPHGHYVLVDATKVRFHEYYSFSAFLASKESNMPESVVQQSIISQLVSDVGIGTFMSGGVDSTLVSCMARNVSPLKAFTIGIQSDGYDEAEAAGAFARAFETEHFTRSASIEDMQSLLDENAKAFSEPFSDISSLPTLLLAQFAKKQVTVALSGDGGDELFWGYPRSIRAMQQLHYYRGGNISRRLRLVLDKAVGIHTDISKHWNQRNFVGYYSSMLGVAGSSFWLPKVFKHQFLNIPFFIQKAEEQAGVARTDSDLLLLARKLEVDIHLQRILLKVDRASMYHSLEVRVPLLSNSMLEYAEHTNYQKCINGNGGKWNLKQLLLHHVPEELVMAPKKGFVIPLDAWLRSKWGNSVVDSVMQMPSSLAYLFNMRVVEQLLKDQLASRVNAGWFIWSLHSLAAWHRTHTNQYKNCA